MAKPSEVKNKLPESALPEPVETGESLAARSAPIHWKVVLHALMIAAAGLWIYWTALLKGTGCGMIMRWSPIITLRSSTVFGQYGSQRPRPITGRCPGRCLPELDGHLWENEPLGYHLCSLALHIFSGFLIWRLFGRLGLRWGWLGGLLFVIYPLAVESVAWVSEIKNTLSLPFFLLLKCVAGCGRGEVGELSKFCFILSGGNAGQDFDSHVADGTFALLLVEARTRHLAGTQTHYPLPGYRHNTGLGYGPFSRMILSR